MSINPPHPPPGHTVSTPRSAWTGVEGESTVTAHHSEHVEDDVTADGKNSEPPALAHEDTAADVADAVAAATLVVPGVVGLHSGAFGEVGTYLPGRRVAGVKTGEHLTEVHLVVTRNAQLLAVAEAVRRAVQPLVHTPVDVYIEDLDSPATT